MAAQLIIGISGKKQAGKTTVYKFLEARYRSLGKTIGRFPLAEPLKRICIDVLGLEERQCYGDDEEKNSLTEYHWEDLPHFDILCQSGYRAGRMTGRQVLQEVGTGIFRYMNNNVWNEVCLRAIRKSGVDMAVVDDVRFPDEVAAIQEAGGVVIRLTRGNTNDQHPSETSLDQEVFDWDKFDFVLDNSEFSIEETNRVLEVYLTNRSIILEAIA